MRKMIFIWIIIGLVCVGLFSGCGQRQKQAKVLARVNDYTITIDDFKDEIKYSPYIGDRRADLEELLDMAIQKQVLIQEAQKQGLDREKSFMKTIERYWRQTLIKELLTREAGRIHREVSKNKQPKALDAWVDSLYEKADIKIYKDALREITD